MVKATVVQKVSDAEIDEAREALAAGQRELVRLREAFLNDEGATWAEVKEQEGAVEFAEAQIERLARARARYQADVRLNAANTLHDEINQHALGIGPQLAGKAREYYAARMAFLAAADEHNAAVGEFRARAAALDVPESTGRPVGFARDGKIQLPRAGGGVQAGRRQLDRIDGAQFVARLDEYGDVEGVTAVLEAIDAELPEPDVDAVHFRTPGGAVFTFDADRVPSAEEIKRGNLIEITSAEAWGAEDE